MGVQRRTMLIVAKRITCTRKTSHDGHVKPEVDITIHLVASESPRGLLQCRKNTCLLYDFRQKPHWNGGPLEWRPLGLAGRHQMRVKLVNNNR